MSERPDLAANTSLAGIIALLGFVLVATAQVANMILARGLAGSTRRSRRRSSAGPSLLLVLHLGVLARQMREICMITKRDDNSNSPWSEACLPHRTGNRNPRAMPEAASLAMSLRVSQK